MRRFKLADLVATAAQRPAGYLADVLASGQSCGEFIELPEAEFQRLRAKYRAPQLAAYWPAWANLIATFRRPEDRGVGDTLARKLAAAGGMAFKEWYHRLTGRDCGCEVRQDRLNRNYPYPPG